MRKPTIITGLDIGSSKISAVTAEISAKDGFRILAHVSSPSRGVSRGVFVDLNEAVGSVSKTLEKLSDKVSRKVGDIYVNITGNTVRGERSKGMVPLSARGREVTRVDIDRCISVASTIKLPFDREVIYKAPHSFSIDDQSGIKNPLGLYASRLACDIYMITANINHIQNIYKCVNNAGYDVCDIIFGSVADAESVLESGEKEEGVVLLNIGASLTECSIFFGGALDDLDVIPFGTLDLKRGFENDAGFGDVLGRIKNRMDEFSKRGGLVRSLVLTGGLSLADGIIEFLEEKFSCLARVGVVKNIRGDISSFESIRGATAIGLARHAYTEYEKDAIVEGNLIKRLSAKFVDIINNYF